MSKQHTPNRPPPTSAYPPASPEYLAAIPDLHELAERLTPPIEILPSCRPGRGHLLYPDTAGAAARYSGRKWQYRDSRAAWAAWAAWAGEIIANRHHVVIYDAVLLADALRRRSMYPQGEFLDVPIDRLVIEPPGCVQELAGVGAAPAPGPVLVLARLLGSGTTWEAPFVGRPTTDLSGCTIRVIVGHVTQDISGRPEMQNRNCQPLVYGGKNHCRRGPHDSQNHRASAVSRPRNRARGKELPPRISRI